jgi:hypothetical protein
MIMKMFKKKSVKKIQIYVSSTAIYSNFRVLWFTFQLSKKCQGKEHFKERTLYNFLFLNIRQLNK